MGIKVGNVVQVKIGTIARANTTNKLLFGLPSGAQVIRITSNGVASDAGTTATVGIYGIPQGETTAVLLGTLDVKTGVFANAALGVGANVRLDKANSIYGSYAEVGAASSTGGDWIVAVEYI